jgi:hypothetical protein
MSIIPDVPGKTLIEGTARKARVVVVETGSVAISIGGFVVRHVLPHGDGRAGSEVSPPASGPSRRSAKAPLAEEPARKPPKPKPAKPKAAKPKPARPRAEKSEPDGGRPAKPKRAKPPKPAAEPGDRSRDAEPHHALNNPVADPDETEYPDPFEKREDPRDPVDPDEAPFGEEPHAPTGAESTSEPPPSQDPEVGDRAEPPRRENLDD